MEVLGKSAFVLFFVAAVEVALGSAMPTQRQIEWADCEIGVIVCECLTPLVG